MVLQLRMIAPLLIHIGITVSLATNIVYLDLLLMLLSRLLSRILYLCCMVVDIYSWITLLFMPYISGKLMPFYKKRLTSNIAMLFPLILVGNAINSIHPNWPSSSSKLSRILSISYGPQQYILLSFSLAASAERNWFQYIFLLLKGALMVQTSSDSVHTRKLWSSAFGCRSSASDLALCL